MTMDKIKQQLRGLLAKLPIDRFRNPPPLVGVMRVTAHGCCNRPLGNLAMNYEPL